ncbi:hypothetical protein Q7C36_017280 [Tachysurus vachellii]|uniref:PH domain-containing protein n=1 Tax=Tachysurus vachellii TaxID=175792 RepID=A0AA88M5N3_TACVA|nr:hypothetical protein Q7C36_017280 [Tachysurus vachellii]
MEVSCNKFQANVFDQSRCQNCFKSRVGHVLTREEMEQVKPIYASWLCLAPEGLDFNNPMQRSRKWQRRFFILYEHGCLEFALDDLPSTIPQGTVNLHHCSDVIDAEGRTGQKNTLCIITSDQDIYIRGDSKEIVNGWCEQLLAFRQTNEQRRRKKGSRMPVPSQEIASTRKSVCKVGVAKAETVEDELCNSGEEEDPSKETEEVNIALDVNVTPADADSPVSSKCTKERFEKDIKQKIDNVVTHQAEGGSVLQLPFEHHSTSLHSPEPRKAVTGDLSPSDLPLSRSALHALCWQEDDTESCAKEHPRASSLAKHMTQDEENNTEKLQMGSQQDKKGRDSCLIESSITDDFWHNEYDNQCKMCTQCSSSRSHTGHIQNTEKSVGLLEAPQSNSLSLRRLQTVEVKSSESTMTPDLLNFKKGWLFMDDHDQWRKYWFILSAHSLHYYFDSGAEELVGEIDLTSCHRVTELHDQRNFGFEIRTHRMVYKFYSTTAGMRQNWIQAIAKNIQDQNAPDVASIPDNWLSRVGSRSGPDVTQESMSLSCLLNDECCAKRRSEYYRCQGRNKTSNWTDTLTQPGTREQEREVNSAEQGISRRRGREERRQKYAIVMGSSVCNLDERNWSTQENQQQERMRQIEEYWLQVEQMAISEERKVLLYPECQSEDCFEKKKLLEHYRKRGEELTIQSESPNEDHSEDPEHGTDWSLVQELTCDLGTEWDPPKINKTSNKQNLTLTNKNQDTTGLDLRRQQISDLLDLQPLSQSRTEFTNEPKTEGEPNLLHDSITSAEPIKSLRSLALWQARKPRIFSESTSLMISEDKYSDQAMVKLLSQEVELLNKQNQDLNQRNQELLNQLAEADREIDRLKSELFHQLELESIVECLESDLARSCGKLQEAKAQLAEMEDNLKDSHQTLQLKEAMLRDLGSLSMDSENKIAFPEIVDRLRQCVQVMEFKVSELVSQQWLSTLTCNDLQTQKTFLVKSDVENGQKVTEYGEMLENVEESNIPLSEGLAHIKDQQHQNRIETVAAELKKRSNLFSLLLEVISQLAGNELTDSVSEYEVRQKNHKVLRRLQLENNIWKSFVNTLKNTTSYSPENEEAACLLQSTEMKLEEVKMYLSLYKSTSSNPLSSSSGLDNTSSTSPEIVSINNGIMEKKQKDVMWKDLKEHMEQRLILIDHVTNNKQFSEMIKSHLKSHVWNKTNMFYPMISVAMDILAAYLVEKLSCSVITQKSVEIQTENQEMEQNNMAVVNEGTGNETITSLKNHIKELEHTLSEGLMSLQQQHVKDKERLKAAFEQNIILLKKSHRKATEVLLLKHQRDQELLQEEKERLLTEDLSDCLTVIEAMKRAHRAELEKMLQEKTYNGDANIDVILKSHSEELSAVQRDLDALSEQYTQKCLDNVHLAEALQAERNSLQQYQYQTLALGVYNQELKNHLAEEMMRLSTVAQDGSIQSVHDRDRYELMIKLQVKESCQEQEIDTLKNELNASKMDQKFASERLHEIQTELRLVKETAEQQISQLKENLRLVYEALEESLKKMTPTMPMAGS